MKGIKVKNNTKIGNKRNNFNCISRNDYCSINFSTA